EDVSISRPTSRLPWGVPVPGDDKHVMYVWFDALTCYLSGIGFSTDKKKFEHYWPADLQIVGKDNNRWHSILWPAMLKSAGLELPKKVLVHSYILGRGGVKMSKTIGNVVDPIEIVGKYGTDAFRYFLSSKIIIENDGVFDEDYFREVYNADLSNGLGNLVQRVAVMIDKYLDGIIPEGHTEVDMEPFERHMGSLGLHKAVEYIWSELKGLDQYIEEEKPWVLAKENPDKLGEVLGNLAASIRELNKMIAPFMPDTSGKIDKIFGGKKVKVSEPLFPRLS
ncbi:methionine--tRNA ligase, partial [bacterium (Candidatus Howlettbacteria) CG_4_10_14_0_8_um_filter_40_9]